MTKQGYIAIFLWAIFFINTTATYAIDIEIESGITFDVDTCTLEIDGNIRNNSVLQLSSGIINLGGNWLNSGNFISGEGVVTLNSSSNAQTVTTGGESSAFKILTITNSHSSGVTFADALHCETLNAASGVKKLLFSNSGVHKVSNTFNVNGSSGNLIMLVPETDSTIWYIDTLSTTVNFLDVSYSHETEGKTITAIKSVDGGNNKNWEFLPTAITLILFSAEVGEDSSVILTWETATEVDNAGFNIYRSKMSDGTYKKVNGKLIPAEGSGSLGASYSFEDTPGSGAFYYKLEDVDYNATSAMHGPVKVRVRSAGGDVRRRR